MILSMCSRKISNNYLSPSEIRAYKKIIKKLLEPTGHIMIFWNCQKLENGGIHPKITGACKLHNMLWSWYCQVSKFKEMSPQRKIIIFLWSWIRINVVPWNKHMYACPFLLPYCCEILVLCLELWCIYRLWKICNTLNDV